MVLGLEEKKADKPKREKKTKKEKKEKGLNGPRAATTPGSPCLAPRLPHPIRPHSAHLSLPKPAASNPGANIAAGRHQPAKSATRAGALRRITRSTSRRTPQRCGDAPTAKLAFAAFAPKSTPNRSTEWTSSLPIAKRSTHCHPSCLQPGCLRHASSIDPLPPPPSSTSPDESHSCGPNAFPASSHHAGTRFQVQHWPSLGVQRMQALFPQSCRRCQAQMQRPQHQADAYRQCHGPSPDCRLNT